MTLTRNRHVLLLRPRGFHNGLINQLHPPRLPVPSGRILYALFRDLPRHHSRLLGFWHNRIHDFGISIRVQKVVRGAAREPHLDTLFVRLPLKKKIKLLLTVYSFFFFGGLSIPLSQAIFAHLFSYNITWSATIKEVERSNFFKEIPKIIKRFWFPIGFSFLIIVGIVLCSMRNVVKGEWRVDGEAWAVILPLSYGFPPFFSLVVLMIFLGCRRLVIFCFR